MCANKKLVTTKETFYLVCDNGKTGKYGFTSRPSAEAYIHDNINYFKKRDYHIVKTIITKSINQLAK